MIKKIRFEMKWWYCDNVSGSINIFADCACSMAQIFQYVSLILQFAKILLLLPKNEIINVMLFCEIITCLHCKIWVSNYFEKKIT